MLKIIFNKAYHTQRKIINSNKLEYPVRIAKRGLIIDARDVEIVEKLIGADYLKVKSVTAINFI